MYVCVALGTFAFAPLVHASSGTPAQLNHRTQTPQSSSSPPTILSSDPIPNHRRSNLQSRASPSHPKSMASRPYKQPARWRPSHWSHGRRSRGRRSEIRRWPASHGRRDGRRRRARPQRIWFWRPRPCASRKHPTVVALVRQSAASERCRSQVLGMSPRLTKTPRLQVLGMSPRRPTSSTSSVSLA